MVSGKTAIVHNRDIYSLQLHVDLLELEGFDKNRILPVRSIEDFVKMFQKEKDVDLVLTDYSPFRARISPEFEDHYFQDDRCPIQVASFFERASEKLRGCAARRMIYLVDVVNPSRDTLVSSMNAREQEQSWDAVNSPQGNYARIIQKVEEHTLSVQDWKDLDTDYQTLAQHLGVDEDQLHKLDRNNHRKIRQIASEDFQ